MNKCVVFVFVSLLCVSCFKKEDKSPPTTSTSSYHSAGENAIKWEKQAGWIEEQPSAMRKAQYRLLKLNDDPEDVTVAIFYFGADQGGSVDANLERWYGQFIQSDGRPTKETAKILKNNVHGLQQTTVDVSGTYLESMRPMGGPTTRKPKFRMLAGIVETPNGPWFVKMTGPTNSVDHWKESFETFMKSIKG